MKKIFLILFAFISATVFGQNLHSNEESAYGIIYNQNTWSSPTTGFTNFGTATVTLTSSKLVFSSGTVGFTQALGINGASMLDNWTVTEKIKVGTKGATVTDGFAIGKYSLNTYTSTGLAALFHSTSGTDGGKLGIEGANGTGFTEVALSTAALTFSVNDYILVSITRNGYNVVATARNITTNSLPITVTYTFSTLFGASIFMDNTGLYATYNNGGSFTVDSVSVSSTVSKNARLAVLCDSKGQGYYVSIQANRYGDLLNQYYRSTINLSGQGDRLIEMSGRVAEMIRLHPQQILMQGGSNDVRSGVSSATYLARYDSIVNALTAAGIAVFNTVLYETSVNLQPIVNHIAVTFPAANIIDTWDAMQQPGVLQADNVHPTNYGDSVIFQTILSFQYLSFPNTRYVFPFTPFVFSTGLTNASGIVTNNLSTGVAGGQTVIGGTGSGENLTLQSTSHATKGKINSDNLYVVGTALSGGSLNSNFLNVTGTLPAVPTNSVYAAHFVITTAGTATQGQFGLEIDMNAGYTGISSTAGFGAVNAAAGTATGGPYGAGYVSANYGGFGLSTATTTGTNVGVSGSANGGNISVGMAGSALTAKNSATNIGVAGFALNTGTSPIQIGGVFGLASSGLTFVSAALLAENGATTSPIFLGRDNGTVVDAILDGGTHIINNGTTDNSTGKVQITNTAGADLALHYDATNYTAATVTSDGTVTWRGFSGGINSGGFALRGSGQFVQENSALSFIYVSAVGGAGGSSHYYFGYQRASTVQTYIDYDTNLNVIFPGNISSSVGTGGTNTFSGFSAAYNIQTGTTYTLNASDNGKIVTINNASAITLTVPSGLAAGFSCTVIQLGAGQITFTASGTTINNRNAYTKTAGQYAPATITMYTTNTFVTGGDMQ